MEDKTRQNITSGDIWARFLYMVLFAIAFSIAKFILIVLVIFQFISILVSGRANAQLLQFGKNLSLYVYEVLEFQTFNSEIRPFPFTPWPEEEAGGECWHEAEMDVEEMTTLAEEDSEEDTEDDSEVTGDVESETSDPSKPVDDKP